MTLTEAIAELEPLTLRQLVSLCKRDKVTGVPRSCGRCIVARLLNQLVGEPVSVDQWVFTGGSEWQTWTSGSGREVLPPTLAKFADNFDAGKYPALEV